MESESQNLPIQQAASEPTAEVEFVPEEPTAGESLSQQERKRLAELEGEIEDGFQRWLETTAEIGRRLMAIHDERLYCENYASFEAYCNARWQIERAQGNRLVDYGRVAKAVSPTGDIPIPASERQARELAPLAKVDAKAARRVWKKLLDDNDGAKPRSYTQVNAAVQPERARLKNEQEEAAKSSSSPASQETSSEDSEE
jgi:hypothetical protein